MEDLTHEVFKNKMTIQALQHLNATLVREIAYDMDSEDWDCVTLARIEKRAVQELLSEAFTAKSELNVLQLAYIKEQGNV